jgi:hypothetical protein
VAAAVQQQVDRMRRQIDYHLAHPGRQQQAHRPVRSARFGNPQRAWSVRCTACTPSVELASTWRFHPI